MRICLTFNFDAAARRAVASTLKHRRPETRTQLVQWIQDRITRGLVEAGVEQQRLEAADQPLLPFGGAVAGSTAEDSA